MNILAETLCRLGLHDWMQVAGHTSETIHYTEHHFECRRCGEAKITGAKK